MTIRIRPALDAALALGLCSLISIAARGDEAQPAPAISAPAGAPDGAVPGASQIVILKPTARIDDPQIRLGDLFDNAGAAASAIVGNAPAPGMSLMLPTNWLMAIAQSHGLIWQPMTQYASIRVERSAQEIQQADIVSALSMAVGANGADRQVVLDSPIRLYTAIGADQKIEVEMRSSDPTSGRFAAILRVPAGDPAAIPVRVSGSVQARVEVPVLARPMQPGETIRPQDIATSWQRADINLETMLTDSQQLIGHTPRHSLRPGQTLRSGDVELPLLVQRNERVLIVLEMPGMVLTAEGKALEDGSEGASIRVTNLQSNRPIEASVVATGKVSARAEYAQRADL